MKSFVKFVIAVLTFFIGLSIVGLYYFLRLDSNHRQLLTEPDLFVRVENPKYENPCDYPQPKYREIEAEEAVYRAECFIIENGYTDLPAIADQTKLTPENLFLGTDEEGMRMRHDSLERKAYSYNRDEIYDGSWVIMFRYKPHPKTLNFYGEAINHIGRAVVMDFYGRQVRVQHSNYPLTLPEATIIKQQ